MFSRNTPTRVGKRGKLPGDLPVHRGAFRIQLAPRVDGRRMHVFNRADGMDGAAGLAMGAVGRALGSDYPEHDGPPPRHQAKRHYNYAITRQDFRSCMQ